MQFFDSLKNKFQKEDKELYTTGLDARQVLVTK